MLRNTATIYHLSIEAGNAVGINTPPPSFGLEQIPPVQDTLSASRAERLRAMHRGSRVSLHGLQSRPELNGQPATLILWDVQRM